MNKSDIFPKISKDGKLEIRMLGAAEPNNGRMLWEVVIFYEEANLNEFIFPKGWNYLNFDLSGWRLEDEEGRFFYIPAETQSILLNAETFKIHRLEYQNISTARFEGNYFENDFLIEKYSNTEVKTNLKTLLYSSLSEETK